MVITSKVPPGAVALVALSMAACTPYDEARELGSVVGDDQRGELVHGVEPEIVAVHSTLEQARAAAEDEDPGDALVELFAAADLVQVLSSADAGRCEFVLGAAEVAAQLLDQGAYGEARMGYAIAIRFAHDCEAVLPEELRVSSLVLRRQDARAVQQWASASGEPGFSAQLPAG